MSFNTSLAMSPMDTSLLGGNSSKGLFNIGSPDWQPDFLKNSVMSDDQGFDWSKGLGNFGKFMGGITSLAGVSNARSQMKLLKRQSALQEKSLKANLFNQGTTVQNQLNNQAMAQAQMMYGADGGNQQAMSLASSGAPQVQKTL